MKKQYSASLMSFAIGLIFLHPVAFAAPATDTPGTGIDFQVVTNEELQTRILNTLDNAEGIAAGLGMTEVFESQIKSAREQILSASPEDFEFIPSDMYGNLSLMEVGTGNLRLMYDPALRTPKDKQASALEMVGPGMSIQSTGAGYDEGALEEPGYPNAPASTQTFTRTDTDEGDDTSGGTAEISACKSDGTSYTGRAASMNVALVLDAVRNVMNQACSQTVVLNTSLLCIPFEIVADVAGIVDANLALCNEHNGAAEVSATWHGLKKVHGNVQHVHNDLAAHEVSSTAHDANIDGDLKAHDAKLAAHKANLDTNLTAHDTNIDGDLVAHDAKLAAHKANIDANLTAHDTNIDGDLTAHDAKLAAHKANIDTNLAAHDANLAAHKANIDTNLAAHDANLAAAKANINANLTAHDTNIDGDLQTHDADIKGLLSGAQDTLDDEVELRRVHMQVLQVTQRQRYLVATNEAGVAVSVEFIGVEVFDEDTDSFESISNATVTEVNSGLYDLQLNLNPKSPDKLFRLRVRHDDAVDHFGEILFHRTSANASN